METTIALFVSALLVAGLVTWLVARGVYHSNGFQLTNEAAAIVRKRHTNGRYILGMHLIILYAVALHVIWGVLLLIDERAAFTTAIATLLNFMPAVTVAVMMLTVAALAILALFVPSVMIAVALMIPQQCLLLISAGGAIQAMWLARFPDGIVRSHAFLIADQSPAVLIAVMHTIAILLISALNRRGEFWIGR